MFAAENVYIVAGRERVGTPFTLLKCLRTHYERHCEYIFRRKTALDCRILHIQAQKFVVVTPTRALPVLGSRPWFPLGSPAFPLFLFLRNDHCTYCAVTSKHINSLLKMQQLVRRT